jgi:hypothetical protein
MCAHFMFMIVLSIIVIVFIPFHGNLTINQSISYGYLSSEPYCSPPIILGCYDLHQLDSLGVCYQPIIDNILKSSILALINI